MSFTGPTEYDFRGIGINLILANGEQEKYNTFIESPRTAYMYDVDSRNLKIKDNMIVADSSITINNVRYTVGSNISRGTFGILSVVTTGVTPYALKIQHITDLSGFTNTAENALNEMLCQYIVSQHTYNGTPLAPKILVTGVDSVYQYTVMERLPTSVGRYLSPPDINRSLDFLTHLADCLSYLQKP
jgi:hypothetical protein